ncbi:MAG TPA: hypothetical protein VHQ65_08750 [Thermoanaerobaculia bacterium]|nr:hypothetical protein [Thermoanaerobaculia bacterium]
MEFLAPEEAPGRERLSRVNAEWLDLVRQRPEALERRSFPKIADWARRLTFPVQPWPTFVRAATLRHWQQQAIRMDRLIKSVPRRLFDDDPERLAAFYRIDSTALAAVIIAEPNGIADALSRLDLIETDAGMKIIEINSGSYLGGWALTSVAPAYRDEELLAPLFERHQPRWESTPYVMFRHILLRLLDSPLGRGADRLDVGILFTRGLLEDLLHDVTGHLLQQAAHQAAEELGVEVPYTVHGVGLGELEMVDGCPTTAGGVRLHAIVEQQDDLTSKELFRAAKTGRVQLYTGPATLFLTDKRNIALLYELRDSGLFDDDERQLIEDLVPWSHVVGPTEVEYQGESVYLPDFLVAERENLVLKPGLASSGVEVYLGRVTPPERWRQVVAEAVESRRWVAQELLVPPRDLYLTGERGCAPHDMVWGIYALGGEPGGGYLRMSRAGGGPLNVGQGADVGLFFAVDEEPAGGGREQPVEEVA